MNIRKNIHDFGLVDFFQTLINAIYSDRNLRYTNSKIMYLKFNVSHAVLQTIAILEWKLEGLGDNQEIGSGETIVSKTS